MESRILGFRNVRNTAQGIQNPTIDWNFRIHVSLTKHSESNTWNLESKTVLDFLTWGKIMLRLLGNIVLGNMGNKFVQLFMQYCRLILLTFPSMWAACSKRIFVMSWLQYPLCKMEDSSSESAINRNWQEKLLHDNLSAQVGGKTSNITF